MKLKPSFDNKHKENLKEYYLNELTNHKKLTFLKYFAFPRNAILYILITAAYW